MKTTRQWLAQDEDENEEEEKEENLENILLTNIYVYTYRPTQNKRRESHIYTRVIIFILIL